MSDTPDLRAVAREMIEKRAAFDARTDSTPWMPYVDYARSHAASIAAAYLEAVEEAEAMQDSMRELAMYGGAGGYNAPEFDLAVFENKIRWAIDQHSRLVLECERLRAALRPFVAVLNNTNDYADLENGMTLGLISIRALRHAKAVLEGYADAK